MNRALLPRIPVFSFPKGGGWYACRESSSGPDEGKIEIMFVCPKCEKQGILTLHSIEPDGTVEASVHHSYIRAGVEGCGYHEFVRLEEWPRGWKKIAGEKYVMTERAL